MIDKYYYSNKFNEIGKYLISVKFYSKPIPILIESY